MGFFDCPLCNRGYHQLSQHLRISHQVVNKDERKLLLSLSSGRVEFRRGVCPVPACGKSSSRLDRHLSGHTELKAQARRSIVTYMKRKIVIESLAKLRASNPVAALVSTLDLEEQDNGLTAFLGEVEGEQEEEGVAWACKNAQCQAEKADLQKQVDTLSKSLRNVSRRFRLLQRRWKGSGTVARATGRLLAALRSPGKGGEEELASAVSQDQNQDLLLDQPITPQPSTSTEKEEQLPFPDHVEPLNVLLEDFRAHLEGADPSPRLQNNVGSKIFRIRRFVAFMAVGQSNLASMVFLNQTARMRAWLNSLKQAKIAEPTVHHYLKNVSQFLAFVAETPPPTYRLSRTVMFGLQREIKSMIKSVRRNVVMHEVQVKQAKQGRLIPKAMLRQCVTAARAAIPEILGSLRESLSRTEQWRFYGHLLAYLSAIYGHRAGVMANMTIAEVQAAQDTSRDGCYVINISSHKTNQAFGAAQLALTAEEYGWMSEFLEMRKDLVGGTNAHFFFFTSSKKTCKNLNQYFQEAWAEMGLEGTPTFTDIRTSVATHAKNTHSPGKRHKVAQFMCHDTSTADRFYALNLNAKQAAEHRRLFEEAMVGDEAPAGSPIAGQKKTQKRHHLGQSSPGPSAPSSIPTKDLEASESPSEKKRRLRNPTKRSPYVLLSPLKRKDLRKMQQQKRVRRKLM